MNSCLDADVASHSEPLLADSGIGRRLRVMFGPILLRRRGHVSQTHPFRHNGITLPSKVCSRNSLSESVELLGMLTEQYRGLGKEKGV